MNDRLKKHMVACTAAVIALCSTPVLAERGGKRDAGKFEEFAMFFEICGTDKDAGLKVLLGGEPWKQALILGPDGKLIYRLGPRLADVGSGTVFLESAEPPFKDLPLDEFLTRFPEGRYTAWAQTLEGDWLKGAAVLSHNLPAGPRITSHQDDEVVELTGENLVVTWDKVKKDFRGGPLASAIIGYIVTVTYEANILGETVERELTIDAVPPDKFSAQIPADFLRPNTEVQIEVAAREQSGNRTSKEIFVFVVDDRPNAVRKSLPK